MSTISRRDLFKFGGVAAAGAMGVSMLGGCAPQQPVAATGEAAAAAGDGTPAFFVKPEPITDIADTRDYDVVVIGAGAAGVPAPPRGPTSPGRGKMSPQVTKRGICRAATEGL